MFTSVGKTKATALEIKSPSEDITLRFSIYRGQAYYEIIIKNRIVVHRSKLGFKIAGENILGNNVGLLKSSQRTHHETIEMLWGEDRLIKNHYNELTVHLVENEKHPRKFNLIFRIFDDGVAFRYELFPYDNIKRITITEELTEFNFNPASSVWYIPAYQPDRYEYDYKKTELGHLKGSVHTPFTIKAPSGYYFAIHEAALYDYGSMTLKLNDNYILKSDITPMSDHTIAHIELPFSTPWRLIMVASSATELTKNRLIYVLNDSPSQDFSWVKTLKFIGIWWSMYVGEWTWAPGEKHGATTKHAKEYIDAAVRLGISGLLIEGWNDGWEGDWLENGAKTNFTTPMPDFDLPTVARYANQNHIELVGHHETVGFIDNYEKQLEAAYNYYAANGIHYIKTGYAGSKMTINGRREYHHSQLGVNHYQKTIELAAKKHICLNIHEPIKGTGIERTWPNLLAREGARGQEYEGGALSPSHACFLPYTRLLSGGMDYTSGIFDIENPAKRIATTLARQLAYFVTIYSGMQMAADRPIFYEEKFKEAFKFIHDVPTSFEKNLPLAGEIGEYYVVARKDRDSHDWYIGGVTSETSRDITLELNFLDQDSYLGEFYTDAHDSHYRTNPLAINIYHKTVAKGDKLKIHLAPGGGFAIRLIPKS
ncbi:glycoside hydrolase family 97 protein [Candidatus Saccharibacteria bacterium]|nr:glycoside hydrolase family 97 protein [Candidatus Saccharibacteria bacterium]